MSANDRKKKAVDQDKLKATAELDELRAMEKQKEEEVSKMRVTLKGLQPQLPNKPVEECKTGEKFSPFTMSCLPDELVQIDV